MSFSADPAWERVKTLAPFPAKMVPYYRDILSQYESAYEGPLHTWRPSDKDKESR